MIARLARSVAIFLFAVLALLAGCSRKNARAPLDHPRLTSKVTMRDVTFRSAALGREMQYRVILPTAIPAGQKLPAVYLLHGAEGSFRAWSNNSGVARSAEQGLILIMPEGDGSYYTNSAERPQDRYEDYIVKDLVDDVEAKFPVATGRQNRAIAGISMGGFGAVKLALRHPDLFVFAGGLSSSFDATNRPFSIRRIGQWRRFSSIFGPQGGQARRDNDPLFLARSADQAETPYLFLSCGDGEVLLPTNRQFAALLEQRNFAYEFHLVEGGHDWANWDAQLPSLFESILKHMKQKS